MVKKFGNIIDYHITKYERPQSIFDFLDSTLVNGDDTLGIDKKKLVKINLPIYTV